MNKKLKNPMMEMDWMMISAIRMMMRDRVRI